MSCDNCHVVYGHRTMYTGPMILRQSDIDSRVRATATLPDAIITVEGILVAIENQGTDIEVATVVTDDGERFLVRTALSTVVAL